MNLFKRLIVVHIGRKIIGRLDRMPKLKGWRTIALNVMTAVIALVAMPQITEMVPAQYLLVGVNVLNIAMRLITSTPVGVSQPPMVEVKK